MFKHGARKPPRKGIRWWPWVGGSRWPDCFYLLLICWALIPRLGLIVPRPPQMAGCRALDGPWVLTWGDGSGACLGVKCLEMHSSALFFPDWTLIPLPGQALRSLRAQAAERRGLRRGAAGLILLLISCVTLGGSLSISGPHLPDGEMSLVTPALSTLQGCCERALT